MKSADIRRETKRRQYQRYRTTRAAAEMAAAIRRQWHHRRNVRKLGVARAAAAMKRNRSASIINGHGIKVARTPRNSGILHRNRAWLVANISNKHQSIIKIKT